MLDIIGAVRNRSHSSAEKSDFVLIGEVPLRPRSGESHRRGPWNVAGQTIRSLARSYRRRTVEASSPWFRVSIRYPELHNKLITASIARSSRSQSRAIRSEHSLSL